MHQLLVRFVQSVVPAAFSDYRGFLDDSSLSFSNLNAEKSGGGGTLSVDQALSIPFRRGGWKTSRNLGEELH